MKIEKLIENLSGQINSLACPRCGASFHIDGTSLVCENAHCYDLSKRGYVNLAPSHNQKSEKYDQTLFESRKLALESGFYTTVLDAIADYLPKNQAFSMLDVGCGEGFYSRALSERFPQASLYGADLSRDAITQATRIPSKVHWLIADLKHLPFKNSTFDILLDVLTPADYAEFRRVLSSDGLLLKLVPMNRHLEQVRKAAAPWLRNGESYSNERIIDHLKENCNVMDQREILITAPVSGDLSKAFLHMTPMTFGLSEDVLSMLSVEEITLHLQMFVCRFQ